MWKKSFFLTNLVSNIINDFEQVLKKKLKKTSPRLHRELYQITFKCFTNCIPLHTIPKFLNDEEIDVVIEETVSDKVFEKSDTEVETHEIIGELKYPEENDDGGTINLDDLNEKEKNDPRVQSMFKRI